MFKKRLGRSFDQAIMPYLSEKIIEEGIDFSEEGENLYKEIGHGEGEAVFKINAFCSNNCFH